MVVVGDVLEVNSFIFQNIGCIQEVLVNGVRIFIVQVCLCDFYVVEFVLQYIMYYNFYFLILMQQSGYGVCFEKSLGSIV